MGGSKEMTQIIESPGMWVACSVIVIMILVQAIGFVKIGLKGSRDLGMNQNQVKQGMKAAMITTIAPTLTQVIILVSLLAALGTPNAFMRVIDIGAPRSELTQLANAASVYGVEVGGEGYNLEVFSAALWAMAVVNGGWMLVALLTAKKMGVMVDTMNKRFAPKWVKGLMSGSMIGLFAYLLSNNIMGSSSNRPMYILAAAIGAVSMFSMKKIFAKNKTLLATSLGLSMIVGVIITGLINTFM